ncbi:MAG TPA: ABC transporter permease [Gemmatimonadales bacterium]|nr:ABC transporter permease [Gemmatimonadales bacterium]
MVRVARWLGSLDGIGKTAMVVLLLFGLAALAAPLITTTDPGLQRDVVQTRFLPPFSTDLHGVFHPLGTDRFGRDVWARLAYGARISLGTGVLAVLLSVIIGVAVGAIAGLWQRRVGILLMGLTDFGLALPRVVLLLLLAALWRPSATLVVLVLGFTGWMTLARLVYGETRALVVRPFVDSAVALGAGKRRILWRHVVPNVLGPVVVSAALSLGNTIMLESGLSYLGLGVQPPTPSWGGMIASGRDTLVNAPWVAIAPGIALVLVVLATALIGDALRRHGPGRAAA